MELYHASLAVRDGDRSTASRELAHRFRPPYFIHSGDVRDEREAQARLDRGAAMVVLDIPENFSRTLYRGVAPATTQLLVDTSRSQTGYLAAAYAQRIAARYGGEWAERGLARRGVDPERLPSIDNQRRVWFNPELKEPGSARLRVAHDDDRGLPAARGAQVRGRSAAPSSARPSPRSWSCSRRSLR
jgi:ABC-2 type transport system permease protein